MIFISGSLILNVGSSADMNILNNNSQLFIKGNESIFDDSNVSIILAIDSSNSQDSSNGRFEREKKSIENFIDNISNVNNKKIKIGLIVWNTRLNQTTSLPLTTNFTKAKEQVALVQAKGNTCLGVGLQAAKEMINYSGNQSKNYIVYISDGLEQYCNSSIDVCPIARELRGSGIIIYTIGKEDPAGNLSCISDYVDRFDLNQMYFDEALDEIFKRILDDSDVKNNDLIDEKEYTKDNTRIVVNSVPDRFGLIGEVNNISVIHLSTNVTASKAIINGPNGRS